MILKILFFGFIFWLLYRLVFHFIIPVYRTTRRMRQGFREMKERMQQAAPREKDTPRPSGNKVGDYIDFEEVRD